MTFDANVNVGPSIYEAFESEPTVSELDDAFDAAGIDGGVVAPLKPPELDFVEVNGRLVKQLAVREEYVGIA